MYYVKNKTYCKYYHKIGEFCSKYGRLRCTDNSICEEWRLNPNYRELI